MKLTVTSSPHIRGDFRSSRMMLDVVIALIPSTLVGAFVLGARALLVTLISMAAAVASEYLYNLVCKRRNTIIDGSALVTGMLFALTLPSTIPYWIAAVGPMFAIIVAKLMCGGLGQNIFNPALLSRAVMLMLFPAAMTSYPSVGVDAVSSSTPLHHMVMPALPEQSILDMFLGNCPGSIGELSALALLLGGIYLIVRDVISDRLSAFCGAVSAGAGAGAGIAYLRGADIAGVSHTVANAIATTGGIVCDGAKASCASKIASAVEAGILGYNMHLSGNDFEADDGLVGETPEHTIANIGRLGKQGMKETNEEIIKIMVGE